MTDQACPITSDDGWMMCSRPIGHEGTHDMRSVALGDRQRCRLTTREDRQRLRTLASAATPGRWFGPRITDAWPPGEYGVYVADDLGDPIPHAIIARMERLADDNPDEPRHNAAFIAAANPIVVTALVDETIALQRALCEALDLFDATWCPEHGHAPKPEQLARAAELRKLVQSGNSNEAPTAETAR